MINRMSHRRAYRRELRRVRRERKATFKRLARELVMYDIVYRACMGLDGA